MSRSFTPPSSLSKEDINTMHEVRREIWKSGLYGFGVGSAAALVLHTAARMGNSRRLWKLNLSRNTAMATFFLGGALGSFVMSMAKGKEQSERLHSIFPVGATPPKQSTYQDNLERSRERANDLHSLHRRRTEQELPDQNDHFERERNRLIRKATLNVRTNTEFMQVFALFFLTAIDVSQLYTH